MESGNRHLRYRAWDSASLLGDTDSKRRCIQIKSDESDLKLPSNHHVNEGFAADHDGKYPTGKTANEAFRELIRADIIQDERIFGCPFSRYIPDNNVGLAPVYDKAVGPGENHWMLVDGLKDDSPPLTPVVFENALEASWPLFWDGSPYDKVRKRGQTWKKGKIIIGLNDNSVSVEKLGGEDMRRQTIQPGSDGKSIFDWVPTAVILDIEE